MNKKILICLDRNQFIKFDYKMPYYKALVSIGCNSGNNVFQYALQKLLTNKDTTVEINTEFLHVEIDDIYNSIDYINNNFDCVVFSPANMLAKFACDGLLQELANRINLLKIPVYAIGLGTQSDRFYSTDYTVDIKPECYKFIKCILDSGGRIALRGYFTAEVMNKLGFSEQDYTVVGCPSLFLKGRNLKVEKKASSPNDLNVAINGFRAWNNPNCGEYLKSHNSSIFICQDEFYKLLYNDYDFDWKEYQYLADPKHNWDNAYINNQIKLYCDFQTWYYDLLNSNINFSFGCRIHGNIVSILAGIPAYVDIFDSRVRELSEYFNLPSGYIKEGFCEPWDIYQKTDYTEFNTNFAKKYDIFKNFMNECGLQIDTDSKIENLNNIPQISNQDYIKNLSYELSQTKNIVFVAHEFGLFKGHGGIASYLYNICGWLLKATNYRIYVMAGIYDDTCEFINHPNFKILKLRGTIDKQRELIYKYCKNLAPDYIEFADFQALGLECVKKKAEEGEFKNTILVTNNHSATRECWEWSNERDISTAPQKIKATYAQEKYQLQHSDYCIAPSSFLAEYVQKKYELKNKVIVFANPYFQNLTTKAKIRIKLSEYINLSMYDKTFNIVLITRFECRKHQEKLVNAVVNLCKKGLKIKLFLAGNTSAYNEKIKDYRYKLYSDLSEFEKSCLQIFDFMRLEEQEKLIAIADLTVIPSTYENQPVAMVETVLRGIPVMGSFTSGIKDYTEDNELLFDAFSQDDLEKKIEYFYNLDSSKREELTIRQRTNLLKFIAPEESILKRFRTLIPDNKEIQ